MITLISHDKRFPLKVSSKNTNGWGLFSSSAGFDAENQFFGDVFSFNDFLCPAEGGIPMHPHEFYEVLCIQLSGTMQFIDSLGNDKITVRGSVHCFSSSTGYLHKVNTYGDEPMRFISVWAKPNQSGLKPFYRQKSFAGDAFPLNQLKRLACCDKNGLDEEVCIYANIEVYGGCVDCEGVEVNIGKNLAMLYLINGTMEVNHIEINAGDHLRIDKEENLFLKGKDNAEFILLKLDE